jgi:hypothetical protein
MASASRMVLPPPTTPQSLHCSRRGCYTHRCAQGCGLFCAVYICIRASLQGPSRLQDAPAEGHHMQHGSCNRGVSWVEALAAVLLHPARKGPWSAEACFADQGFFYLVAPGNCSSSRTMCPALPACLPACMCVPQLPVDCVVSLGCGGEPRIERSKGLSSVSTVICLSILTACVKAEPQRCGIPALVYDHAPLGSFPLRAGHYPMVPVHPCICSSLSPGALLRLCLSDLVWPSGDRHWCSVAGECLQHRPGA